MSLPFISCITVTYGRVAWLEEAISHFVAQDYQGPKEMIVLNTCPEQTLRFDRCEAGDSVIVKNVIRPSSLGLARNIAISFATGSHIVVWDDDDHYLPHHLSTIANAFVDNDWIWLEQQFYSLGEEIKDIVPGACPVFSFTKKAFKEVGGYAAMDVGEDRQFISRVTEKFKGAKIPVDGMPSFIYAWANEVYHISGQGESPTAHSRVAQDLQSRIKRGIEPTGEILLQPKRKLDWKAKAEAFMADREKRSKKNDPGGDVAIVLLGRYGDIINALPIARHVAETYGRPHWIVSREFASIFEGVSYVHPVPLDLKNHQLQEGLAYANKNYKHVLSAQIWGRGWEQIRECASYNRESWRMCGFAHRFDDPSWQWRPLFDGRDFVAEEAFYKKSNPEGKNILVTNVRKSVSSPFKYGNDVLTTLRSMYPQVNVIDAADWELPHIYDMLGLMERAVAVVSIDTALIHLSAACNVPLIALINPLPWQGSEVRGNKFLSLTYSKIAETPTLPVSIVNAIDSALNDPTPRTGEIPLVREAPERQIIHVVERHSEANPVELRRKAVAWRSWDTLYATGAIVPVHVWDEHYPRNALSIGDPRPLPYFKDVLEYGLREATDDDIVTWTNDDNFIHPDLPALLRYHVSLYECCCSSRCEFKDVDMPSANNKPDVFARNSMSHMGRDLFAATSRWWREHLEQIPDFIIGASSWDLCMAAIVRLHFGIRTTRENLENVMFPADLPRGYVSHRYHPPKWDAPGNRQAPSEVWNRKLFKTWAGLYLPELKFHGDGMI